MPQLPLHQKWHTAAVHARVVARLTSCATLHSESRSQRADGYLRKLRDGVQKVLVVTKASLQAEAREMIQRQAGPVQTEVKSQQALNALAKWQQGVRE
jgi:signal transduction histidine kinase